MMFVKETEITPLCDAVISYLRAPECFFTKNKTSTMKSASLLACVFLFSGLVASAQKQNVLKVNVFSPLVKSGSFFYERAIGKDKSVQLGVGFTSYHPGDTKFS